MTALDDLPDVGSFFGVDLKTGALIVAALGVFSTARVLLIRKCREQFYVESAILDLSAILCVTWNKVHPMAYGCSFCIPLSYLLVTIWILVALYFAASVVLFFGILKEAPILCVIWIWYAVIFVAVMLIMMMLLAIVFTSRKQKNRVFIVILGMLWYILTIYFILVVNSHRKQLVGARWVSLMSSLPALA